MQSLQIRTLIVKVEILNVVIEKRMLLMFDI